MVTWKHLFVLAGAVQLACSPASRSSCEVSARPSWDIRQTVSDELMTQANHGRTVLQADGFFSFPAGVTRVWVDVGAHFMETTQPLLAKEKGVALVAVEPLAECWSKWPKAHWLVALPVALYLDRGSMDFHVNASKVTSSLDAWETTGDAVDARTQTVETRSVPVLRLEDVLSAIPRHLDIEYVKIDVQGVDLQVLRSAGEQLRRVGRVRVEVERLHVYKGVAGEHPGTEQETVDYMSRMGFKLVRDLNVHPKGFWLDKEFVNVECRGGWFARLRQRLASRH
jgi:FkbM family methyltransferase